MVAQILDYGAWVTTLDRDTIIDLANAHLGEVPFEQAFEDVFGTSAPDELNSSLQLTIVATDLDAGSERIVTYLRNFGVPLNAVFFTYLEDDGRTYLARSWLARDDDAAASGTAYGKSTKGKRAEWNGRDWFVSFGEYPGGRSWEDGRRLGFISAGGGDWYSRSLRSLPLGARVNVHIPTRGYVAVGETLGEAMPASDAQVLVDGQWVRLTDQDLVGSYEHRSTGGASEDDTGEWVVPVRWWVAQPAEDAFWVKGMFANQNSACKLRQEFTLDRLAQHFNIDEGEAG